MVTLPFHVDSPLPVGAFTLLVCLGFTALLWASGRNVMNVGGALDWFFERKFAVLGPKKARRLGRRFLLAAAILFGVLSAFSISVAAGVLRSV